MKCAMVTEHNCEDRCVTLMTYHRPGLAETLLAQPESAAASRDCGHWPLTGRVTSCHQHWPHSQVNSRCRLLYFEKMGFVLCVQHQQGIIGNNITHVNRKFVFSTIDFIGALANFIFKLCDATVWYLVNNLALAFPPVSINQRKINIQFKMHCLAAQKQDGQFMGVTLI